MYIYIFEERKGGRKQGRKKGERKRENIIFNPDSTFLNFLPNLKITQKFNCSCD